METRKATSLGPDGPVHTKVVDDQDKPHWLMPGQFVKGISRDAGTRYTIEHQTKGWYAIRQEKK